MPREDIEKHLLLLCLNFLILKNRVIKVSKEAGIMVHIFNFNPQEAGAKRTL